MYTLITLSAVPDFAVGYVRDLRVRWTLEEAGQAYSVRTVGPDEQKSAAYRRQQPFGQVPVLLDDGLSIFESGAILRHLGDKLGLMPKDAQQRQLAEMWLYAALNSVEPHFAALAELGVFHAGEAWVEGRKPGLEAMARRRLGDLEAWLSGADYLAGSFSVADIMMTSVLRLLDSSGLKDEFPAVSAYQARCTARPAYQRGMAAQVAQYAKEPAAA
ncbi:glutathione S-transferase family protein [Pseudoduganella violaceinigra]|uniref:glutathione S-transferase family protein n=1 Tax=Pseudoduganella violaceinigra TaxID=246602 RepID=UPI000401CDE0|nr:glutathione S-transferase family protein [Pseudoduganella violaceinigra]